MAMRTAMAKLARKCKGGRFGASGVEDSVLEPLWEAMVGDGK